MTLSPQGIRETQFKSAKRGYDQSEVNTFQEKVADALEAAQNEATAMEARARAAVARLQELSAGSDADVGADDHADERPAVEPVETAVQTSVDDAETISRTLLLAQRTADQTVAEANAEADRLLSSARADASARLDGARAEVEQIIETGRVEARRAGEADKARVEAEVQALLARRDFLESDVEHLEQFLVAQRERITEAAGQLQDMVQRIPAGLADMRRPLLSAAADEPATDDDTDGLAAIRHVATGDEADEADEVEAPADATGDVWAMRTDDAATAAADAGAERTADDDPGTDAGDDATPAGSGSLFDDVERPR